MRPNAKGPLIAQRAAAATVSDDVKRKHRGIGTFHQYRAEVGDVAKGRMAEVSFCVDQSKFFSKEIKTGKVLRDEAGDDRCPHFALVMEKGTNSETP